MQFKMANTSCPATEEYVVQLCVKQVKHFVAWTTGNNSILAKHVRHFRNSNKVRCHPRETDCHSEDRQTLPSPPRPPGEPVDGSLGCRRLRKWSNVGIGDHRFVHIECAVTLTIANGHVTKVDVVESTARAEISH
jgi:hypothetical protein